MQVYIGLLVLIRVQCEYCLLSVFIHKVEWFWYFCSLRCDWICDGLNSSTYWLKLIYRPLTLNVYLYN